MNIVDFLLIILVAVIAVMSAKKGFLMSLFNIISYFIAGILAKIFSSPIASYIYSGYISEKVLLKLNELMPSGSVEGELIDVVDGVFESLPAFVFDTANHFGILPLRDYFAYSSSTETLTVDAMESNIIAPVILNVLSVILLIALFVIFSILLKMVFSFINKGLTSKKHEFMRKTNAFLGAMLGVIKGIVPAGLICAVLNIAAPVLNNENLFEFVNGSYFCLLVADILK